jgi:hypothetical protein
MEPQKKPLHALFQFGTKRSPPQNQYMGLFTHASDARGRKQPSRAAVLRQFNGYSLSGTSTKVMYDKTKKADQNFDSDSMDLSEVVPTPPPATPLSFSNVPPLRATSVSALSYCSSLSTNSILSSMHNTSRITFSSTVEDSLFDDKGSFFGSVHMNSVLTPCTDDEVDSIDAVIKDSIRDLEMLYPLKDFKCDYPSCNVAPFQTQYLLK